MNIAENIEARIKAFLNKPIPPISLKYFIVLITALLAVGSITGLYIPFVSWVFIITFAIIGLAFVIPYLASEKKEST